MRAKGWEERGPKAHSKNSDFGTPLIQILLGGLPKHVHSGLGSGQKFLECRVLGLGVRFGILIVTLVLGSAKSERLKGRNGSLSKIFADLVLDLQGKWFGAAENRRKLQKIAGNSFDPFLPFSLAH